MLCAYYEPAQVRVSGDTDFYMWGDKSIRFHRCKVCGNATHWSAVDNSAAHGGERAIDGTRNSGGCAHAQV